MNLNRKQIELLNKEFPINNSTEWQISRGEYEGFPCPMVAFNWSDEQMEALSREIGKEFNPSDFSVTNQNEAEWMEEEFYRIIENVAVRMGMKYYEDLTSQEHIKFDKEFENII